jgi:hypothetical protein
MSLGLQDHSHGHSGLGSLALILPCSANRPREGTQNGGRRAAEGSSEQQLLAKPFIVFFNTHTRRTSRCLPFDLQLQSLASTKYYLCTLVPFLFFLFLGASAASSISNTTTTKVDAYTAPHAMALHSVHAQHSESRRRTLVQSILMHV